MTLSSTDIKKSYAGDGSTTAFSFPYLFLLDDDLEIVLRDANDVETVWTLNTEYTVSGAGNAAGGTVTVSTSPTDYTPAVGETLVIRRVVDLTQENDIATAGEFSSANIETSLDKLVMMVQQLNEELARSVKVSVSDTSTGLEIPLDTVRASKFLAFDASGDPIASEGSGTPASAFAATFLDDADAAAARATLDFTDAILDRSAIGAAGGVSSINGANITGDRNAIINGNFDVWQRDTSQTSSGYSSDDRWRNAHSGSSKTHSRQEFSPGQTDVPGNPRYFSRTIVTSSAGASNFVYKDQAIEDVRTYSGKEVTLTFYAQADTTRNIAVEFIQSFGSGGSPSSSVVGIGVTTVNLTGSWQRHDVKVTIPSISGETIGSNEDSYLAVRFWFDAGSDFNARTNSLGQQSGTFDIDHVSLVEGDATNEDDPFPRRHIANELALCQRYYQVNKIYYSGLLGSTTTGNRSGQQHFIPMRAAPTGTITARDGLINVAAGSPTISGTTETETQFDCEITTQDDHVRYIVTYTLEAEL